MGPIVVPCSSGSPSTTPSAMASDAFEHLVEDGPLHEDPGTGHARLSRVASEHGLGGDTGGGAPRSASANTMLGDLPPSSKMAGVSVSAAARWMSFPVADEPVMLILFHPVVTDQRSPRLGPEARDDIEHPGRQHVGQQLTEAQYRHAGLFGRLHHHGVARGHGQTGLARAHGHRRVPGDDGADHPVGLAPGEAESRRVEHDAVAPHGLHGHLGDPVPHEGHADAGPTPVLLEEPPVVQGLEVRQLLAVGDEDLRHLLEVMAPGRRRERGPGGKGGRGRRHRRVHVVAVARRDARPHLAGRRVHRVEQPPGRGGA